MDAQLELYTRQLAKHDPRAVAEACEEWARTQKFWPALSELVELVRQAEQAAERKRAIAYAKSSGRRDDPAEIHRRTEHLIQRVRRLTGQQHPAVLLSRLNYDDQVEIGIYHEDMSDDDLLAALGGKADWQRHKYPLEAA